MAKDLSKENRPIILENGGQFIKIGYAGEPDSLIVFPNVIGYPLYTPISSGVESEPRHYYVGEEAINLEGVLTLIHPIHQGRIEEWDPLYSNPSTRPKGYEGNWDALTKIWSHILKDKMKLIDPQNPILVIVPTTTPEATREKMTSIFFEELNMSAIAFAGESELSLYAVGKTTGVVVQAGGTVTSIVPIHDGEPILDSVRIMKIGGLDIDRHLARLMRLSGWMYHGDKRPDIFRDMKEKLCYIAVVSEDELIKADRGECDKQYYLSDGESITLGSHRFQAPELYFNPGMLKIDSKPLDKLLVESVDSCPSEIRQELYTNIYLAGGSTLFPGFKQRLQLEVSKLTPDDTIVRVLAPNNRGFLAWVGGTMITEDEYKWLNRETV